MFWGSAGTLFQRRCFNHNTDALVCLHWLRVAQRNQFKIVVLANKVLHMGLHHVTCVRSFAYTFDLPVGVFSALPALIAWSCHHSNCPLLAVEHALLRNGTVCCGRNNVISVVRFSLKTWNVFVLPVLSWHRSKIQLFAFTLSLSLKCLIDWLLDWSID